MSVYLLMSILTIGVAFSAIMVFTEVDIVEGIFLLIILGTLSWVQQQTGTHMYIQDRIYPHIKHGTTDYYIQRLKNMEYQS